MASETCDPDAESCALASSWPSLSFDGTGNATDNMGRVTRWERDSYGNVTITYPTGRRAYYASLNNNRIDSYSDGKESWSYTYPNDPYGGVTLVYAPDSAQPRQILWSTSTGQVTSDWFGSLTTTYAHDDKGRVTSVKLSNGDVAETRYSYDARGNVTETRRISVTPGNPGDIVTSSVYPAGCDNPKTCNKPVYTIDARGGRTDFSYDPNHGGITSVTQPAGANGVRPEARYGYNALSATYRNGSGSLVQGSPVYKLTATSACTTQWSCAGSGDEVKSTISYGSNDALLPVSTTSGSGDGAVAATTATTYYPTGDVRTVDGAMPGSADTVRHYYDAGRQLVGSIGPDPDGGGPLARRAIRWTYNADGRMVRKEAGTAAGQGDGDMGSFQPIEQELADYDGQGRKAKESFVSGGVTSDVRQYSPI